MRTAFILILLSFHLGLCAQKHIEIKVSFEPGSPGITPRFKVDVKNLTDSTLFIVNLSKYYDESTFDPESSYFVADYVLKDGKSGEVSGIPLVDFYKNELMIEINPRQSIKNEFPALGTRGSHGFSGIFPSDFDLSKVAKVRFRLVKVLYGIRFGFGLYPETEFSSNWVTIKGL